MKKSLLALLLGLSLAAVSAQGSKYEDVLTQKKTGARTLEVLPGASAYVYQQGCSTSASGVGTTIAVFTCATLQVGDTIELAGQVSTILTVPSTTSITVSASMTWSKNARILRTSAPAAVAEDRGLTSTLTQPLTADSEGKIRFYTPVPYFDLKVVYGSSTGIVPDARGASGAGTDISDFDADADGVIDLAEALATPGLVAVTSVYSPSSTLPAASSFPGYLFRTKDTNQPEVWKLSTRTAAGIYEWLDVAYGRAGTEIGYPVYSVDQATAPTLTTACPTGYKPILEVRETGQHIACLAGVWTELDVGTGESVIDPTGAVGGDALVYNNSTGKFEPETLPGGGDVLYSVVDLNSDGVIDLAEALEVNPAPCSGGQFVSDIAADGTLTCSTPPSDTSVRMAATYADAGTGANGSEWTGWEDALAAGSTVVLQAGEFQVGVDGFGALPNGVRVLCREGAVIEWPPSRTAGASMFTVAAGQTAEFQGCSFQPGRTVDAANGHADGQGQYFLLGGSESTTTATLRIVGNTFGPGVISASGLDWKHIQIQGAADLVFQGNRVDFANQAIYLVYGSSNPAWTVRLQVRDNLFAYTDAKSPTDEPWFPILGDATSGTQTNVVTVMDSTFSGNVVSGNSGKIIALSTKLLNFAMANNVISGSKVDVIFSNTVRDTANTIVSENVTVEGNTCSSTAPSVCNISIGEATGATISGNRLVMNTSGAAHNAISFGNGTGATSSGAVISGNSIEYVLRATQDYSAIAVDKANDVVLRGNLVINGPRAGIGIGDLTGNSAARVSASNNLFVNRTNDTDKLTLGVIRFWNNSCTTCSFLNNEVYDVGGATPMFTAPTTVPSVFSVGNFGGALGTARYRLGPQEMSLGGDLVTLKRNDLQTANPYTIEVPRDAPTSWSPNADSVLMYRRRDADYFWEAPVVYEADSGVIWPTTPGTDTSATTTNSAYAANSYTDLYSETAVLDPNVGAHTWSWPAGTNTGRLRVWWNASDGSGPLFNCTNSVISVQQSTNAGGAWTNLITPITCVDDSCSAAGAGATQFVEGPLIAPIDLVNLRFRVQINAAASTGDCRVRVNTVQFAIAPQWTVGAATRIRDQDRVYPIDWEFGRGVVEDISLWFWTGSNGPRILWRDTTGTANDCFEFDHDAIGGDGTRFCEDTKVRGVTDFYMGTGAAGDFSIFFDDDNTDARLWWDDNPGVVELNNSGLNVDGAVDSDGAISGVAFNADQNATTGHMLCLMEGADDGSEQVCDKVLDAGLTLGGANTGGGYSGGICSRHTSGRIPDACVGDGVDDGGAGATAGAAGDVQYSADGAGAHGAEAALHYNEGTDTLSVPNLSVTNFTPNTSATELDLLDGGLGLSELTPSIGKNDNSCSDGNPVGDLFFDTTDGRVELCAWTSPAGVPPVVIGANTLGQDLAANPAYPADAVWLCPAGLCFEGTANAIEGKLTWAPTTSDRTITLPDATGNVVVDAASSLTSASLLSMVTDETGTGVSVFGTSPTIATPSLTGKVDSNNVAVDDDDCTGEQGLWWYDTTDSAFELCNANSGTPATVSAGGAPTSAQYWTAAADGTLSAEVVVNNEATLQTAIGSVDLSVVSGTETLTNKTVDVEGTGNAITTVDKTWYPAAGCNNATAAPFFDLPTTSAAAAACITGTNTQKGVLDYDTTTEEGAQFTAMLPSDWTGAVDVTYKWLAAATTGSVAWCAQIICVADAETDDPAFPAQSTSNCVSDAAKGTTLQTNDAADTGVTITGCAAGELAHFRISRDPDASSTLTDDMTGDARLIGVMVTMRRAQ